MSLFESASLVVTPNGIKASKLYAIKPTDGSGDLSVVRATSATRVNSSGLIESVSSNVPRLDYSNGSCPSILVESQRTNVTQRSEDFSDSYWFKTNSDITSNSVIAPDNVLSADTFSDRVLTSQTYVLSRNQSYTSGTAYTSSFFAKNLDRRYVYTRFVSSVFGTNKYAFFDLQLGTVISVYSGVTAEIIDYGNGWFRCVATSTASVTTSTVNGVFIGLSDDGVNVAYTNPSVKSIYLWGAQLEAGVNATSYIPTTSASVTRNADVISKTGISSLIGQTEGTMFVEFNNTPYVKAGGGFRWLLCMRDPLTNNLLKIYRNTAASSVNIVGMEFHNGTFVLNLFSPNTYNMPLGRNKVLITYQNGLYKLFQNGALRATVSNTLTVPTNMSRVDVGSFVENTPSNLNDGIYTAALYKTALTDAQAINLTTL